MNDPVSGPSDPQHALFQAENVDLQMRISRIRGSRIVHGKVLLRSRLVSPGRIQVTLLTDGKAADETSTNAFGEFRFYDVPDGDLSVGIFIPSIPLRIAAFAKAQGN